MGERVIWEREVDHDRIRARTARFQKMFGLPAVALLIVTLLFGGARNMLGVLVLLGAVGLFWGLTVRFQNLSDAANPRLITERGLIVLGNRQVIIEDVKRFTTIATTINPSFIGSFGEFDVGKAIFRMDMPGASRREPDLVEFGWPNMGPDGLESIKLALEPVLAGKWVEFEDLLDAEERPEPRRGRKRRRHS